MLDGCGMKITLVYSKNKHFHSGIVRSNQTILPKLIDVKIEIHSSRYSSRQFFCFFPIKEETSRTKFDTTRNNDTSALSSRNCRRFLRKWRGHRNSMRGVAGGEREREKNVLLHDATSWTGRRLENSKRGVHISQPMSNTLLAYAKVNKKNSASDQIEFPVEIISPNCVALPPYALFSYSPVHRSTSAAQPRPSIFLLKRANLV